MYNIFANLPEDPLDLIDYIFRALFVRKGMAIRESQIESSRQIYMGIERKKNVICEAEVGTGKTYSYLVAMIIDYIYKIHKEEAEKKYRAFNVIPYLDDGCSVIATSSIALQYEILNRYLPLLSDILYQEGLLFRPVVGVIRKGREHYLCELRYGSLLLNYEKSYDLNTRNKATLLADARHAHVGIDLDRYAELDESTKKKINVPLYCDKNCPRHKECAYIRLRNYVQTKTIDIQICNHNYFLADLQTRELSAKPLIPKYRMLVIDEAHKFMEAAEQIYGFSMESEMFDELYRLLMDALYGSDHHRQKLFDELKLMKNAKETVFIRLVNNITENNFDKEQRSSIQLRKKDLNAIYELIKYLVNVERLAVDELRISVHARKLLQMLKKNLIDIYYKDDMVLWLDDIELQYGTYRATLSGTPKKIANTLTHELWRKYMPKVLVSATMSANGSFDYFKNKSGLNQALPGSVKELCFESPFDYKKKAALYISQIVPRPDKDNPEYVKALCNEIEQLIYLSNGHAAILFTSYRLLNKVYVELKDRITHEIFKMDKNDRAVIENFKKSYNGVLFATGSFWEGIDCPGDILSMLIIANLPFPQRGPALDYLETQYSGIRNFIRKEVIPLMEVKLRQGVGRLIRSESDSGVVAILDQRAACKGKYHKNIINLFEKYTLVRTHKEIDEFFVNHKGAHYLSK